jgi:predicted AlkP superfamily pyrophosphatase or phosphodiesterase
MKKDLRAISSLHLKTKLLLAAVALLLISLPASAQNYRRRFNDLKPTLILISIDGFHPDYLERYSTPTLTMLSKRGVRAKWMTPAFPSLTFPNHYTIATGLYPQNHGIVGNNMYDPDFKRNFGLDKREEIQNTRWWFGEPIWVTAEKQGQRAGAFFFPGTEVEIGGKRPSYWKTYDESVPNDIRVDAALSWLDLPGNERPNMITLYFSDVDHAGHQSGPDSEDVRLAAAQVDKALDRLVAGLKSRQIFDRVNLIIVSDHGMARHVPGQTVLLDDYFDAAQAETIVWSSAIVNIFPKPGMAEKIHETLKAKSPPHVRIYRKPEMPARFHYNSNKRIGDVIVMADEGWTMASRERYRPPQQPVNGAAAYRGVHGYDNQLESMRALFIAHGPAFKRGQVVEAFENVNVYNIMAKVLRLKPAGNDGGEAAARAVLRSFK